MSLHLGDCLEVLPTLPDASVDMVFADLPYGVTANKWDTPIDLTALWRELLRVGRRTASFLFTATLDFALALRGSRPKMRCYDLVWEKSLATGYGHVRRMPMRSHELLLFFGSAASVYNPQKVSSEKPLTGKRTTPRDGGTNYGARSHGMHGGDRIPWVDDGWRYPRSVLRFNGRDSERHHPTQKPVALLEWLLRTYTNPGDTVLDPTAGSGTTAVAAIRTGRKFVCVEKDATYFDTMQRRVAEAMAPPPELPLPLTHEAQTMLSLTSPNIMSVKETKNGRDTPAASTAG